MDDWESYWSRVRKDGIQRRVFWDSPPERASKEDLLRFQPYFSPTLPLLDLGCGNGRQTRFLARHFQKVIGVDVAQSAVDLAKSTTVDENNVEYRVFDGTDTESALRLHGEFGDLNIYMRGVLHLVRVHDRPKLIESLEILLGEKGILYQIELPLKAFYYWRSLPKDIWTMLPKIVRRVGFDLKDRRRHFPDDKWTVLAQGEDVTMNSTILSDGKEAAVPANFLILKPRPFAISVLGQDESADPATSEGSKSISA